MILRQILTNKVLRDLTVTGHDVDRIVGHYEDGPVVDEAVEILRGLSDMTCDRALADDATEYLDLLLSARARRTER